MDWFTISELPLPFTSFEAVSAFGFFFIVFAIPLCVLAKQNRKIAELERAAARVTTQSENESHASRTEELPPAA